MIKFPHIKVPLVGFDGNAFSILGRVCQALRKGKVSIEDQNLFMKEAKSGDYNHLLRTVMATVNTNL